MLPGKGDGIVSYSHDYVTLHKTSAGFEKQAGYMARMLRHPLRTESDPCPTANNKMETSVLQSLETEFCQKPK